MCVCLCGIYMYSVFVCELCYVCGIFVVTHVFVCMYVYMYKCGCIYVCMWCVCIYMCVVVSWFSLLGRPTTQLPNKLLALLVPSQLFLS